MEQKSFLFENVVYEQLINDFEENFNPNFKFSNNQNTTTIFIIERYYFRINSNLTLTLIFNMINSNSIELHIITSGGTSGLLGLSGGAEKSALHRVIKFLKKYDPLKWSI
jgi:hypothetical protein